MICNYTTACQCKKCLINIETAGDLVRGGMAQGYFPTKEELKIQSDKKKQDLKMKPPINFNDKRKKKEWEK